MLQLRTRRQSWKFKKEIHKSFVTWSPDRAALESQVGQLVLSRMAVVSTVKAGRKKVRIIHDLRRSGVNGLSVVPERVILPHSGCSQVNGGSYWGPHNRP